MAGRPMNERTGQRIESSLRKSETATVIDNIYMYPSGDGKRDNLTHFSMH